MPDLNCPFCEPTTGGQHAYNCPFNPLNNIHVQTITLPERDVDGICDNTDNDSRLTPLEQRLDALEARVAELERLAAPEYGWEQYLRALGVSTEPHKEDPE